MVEKTFLMAKRVPLDRVSLGVDVFLIVGGAGFLFNIAPILYIYRKLIQATLFASLLVVGVLTTFLTERGFVGTKHREQGLVIIYSLYLLGAGVVAFFVSLVFRGNFFLAGILPFTGMIVINRMLAKRLRESKLNNSNT